LDGGPFNNQLGVEALMARRGGWTRRQGKDDCGNDDEERAVHVRR
jgi:hypothetical protein